MAVAFYKVNRGAGVENHGERHGPSLAGRCAVFITGADRGIGKSFAWQIGKFLGNAPETKKSALILTALPGSKGLHKCQEEIKAFAPALQVVTVEVDFENAETINEAWTKMIESLNPQDFFQAVFIHNAGTMCDVTRPAWGYDDIPYLQKYFDVNVLSMISLTSKFVKFFKENSKITIVSVTNEDLHLFPSMSVYSSAKAARDTYLRDLISEDPRILGFSYNPGLVKTEMSDYVVENTHFIPLKNELKKMRTEKKETLLKYTALKLLKVLTSGEYKNGGRVNAEDVGV